MRTKNIPFVELGEKLHKKHMWNKNIQKNHVVENHICVAVIVIIAEKFNIRKKNLKKLKKHAHHGIKFLKGFFINY